MVGAMDEWGIIGKKTQKTKLYFGGVARICDRFEKNTVVYTANKQEDDKGVCVQIRLNMRFVGLGFEMMIENLVWD